MSTKLSGLLGLYGCLGVAYLILQLLGISPECRQASMVFLIGFGLVTRWEHLPPIASAPLEKRAVLYGELSCIVILALLVAAILPAVLVDSGQSIPVSVVVAFSAYGLFAVCLVPWTELRAAEMMPSLACGALCIAVFIYALKGPGATYELEVIASAPWVGLSAFFAVKSARGYFLARTQNVQNVLNEAQVLEKLTLIVLAVVFVWTLPRNFARYSLVSLTIYNLPLSIMIVGLLWSLDQNLRLRERFLRRVSTL